MKQFKIYGDDKPGELAKISEALAKWEVNIWTVASEGTFVRVITDDEAKTGSALKEAELLFDEVEVVHLSLSDKPGELAKVARQMGDRSVNINSINILDKKEDHTEVVLEVNDLAKARTILDQWTVK